MDGAMLFEDYLRSQIQLGGKSGVVIIPDLVAKGIADWIEENRNKVEVVRCKDCKWGEEKCGNIECDVDMNVPPEYHGYDWFCPNGERRDR